MITLARFSSSGGRSSFGGRSQPRVSRCCSGGSTPRRGPTTVIHNHITNVYPTRVYGGRSYGYHYGGWGYGYYGSHPYFGSWYGYPMYYGNPVHWSLWGALLGLLLVLCIGAAVTAAVMSRRNA